MNNVDSFIENFIKSGFKPMFTIPGNRIFLTDHSTSTLVWAEGNVVVEHYFLHPNITTPLHSHPFVNRMIFVFGDLSASRKAPGGSLIGKNFKDSDINYVSDGLPIGHEHAFKTGPRGAEFYNLQIWPEEVKNPVSAAIEWIGTLMGPLHEQLIKTR